MTREREMADDLIGLGKIAESIERLTREARELFLRLLGPVADAYGEKLADRINLLRSQNIERLITEVQRRLSEKKIAPTTVELTLLVPIVQYASLENDGDLATKWAGLLATAAAGTPVHPIFPKVLAEITPPEARLLDTLYVWEQESPDSEHNLVLEANLPENELPVICMNLGERLALIDLPFTNFWRPDLTLFRNIRLTPLGTAFVKACRGPETTN